MDSVQLVFDGKVANLISAVRKEHRHLGGNWGAYCACGLTRCEILDALDDIDLSR